MARLTRATAEKARAAPSAATGARGPAVAPPDASSASPPVQRKAVRAVAADQKATPKLDKPSSASAPAAAARREPPPSKGELRAQIEKLEIANSALKAKSRDLNRAAKLAARRITELEAHVARLQNGASEAAAPVHAPPAAKAMRRGRPPGRNKPIDPGDGVPPGIAVQHPEPLDAEAEAAREALEDHLRGD